MTAWLGSKKNFKIFGKMLMSVFDESSEALSFEILNHTEL